MRDWEKVSLVPAMCGRGAMVHNLEAYHGKLDKFFVPFSNLNLGKRIIELAICRLLGKAKVN